MTTNATTAATLTWRVWRRDHRPRARWAVVGEAATEEEANALWFSLLGRSGSCDWYVGRSDRNP